MVKALNPEVILLRTKAGNLENVKNLNLWGNDIEDVSILKDMPNLEVLSLSVNKINTLKHFQHCRKLTELYLRKNLIQDLSEIRYLQNLPNLRVLWLWDNPCSEAGDYRRAVIQALPNLVKLDNQPVTNEERNSGPPREPRREEPRELRREEPRREEPRREEPRREQPRREELRREQARREIKETEDEPSRPPREASPRQRQRRDPRSDSRNENILCAVLALLKELDESGLELVKRDIERKLSGR